MPSRETGRAFFLSLVREHPIASPGGKLSEKRLFGTVFLTEEECGRQCLMYRNAKTYSEVESCVQPQSRSVMLCRIIDYRPHSSSDPLYPRCARAGHLLPGRRVWWKPISFFRNYRIVIDRGLFTLDFVTISFAFRTPRNHTKTKTSIAVSPKFKTTSQAFEITIIICWNAPT